MASRVGGELVAWRLFLGVRVGQGVLMEGLGHHVAGLLLGREYSSFVQEDTLIDIWGLFLL